ncbi:2-nitropropane dioxygenase [Dacryopinax primogenitus]|uniref:2-nitropropane dioxygenase n=1 Tax=Dacryopinax primogenitus (strain DJM 731) TaxID=1858805 RepID=M5G0G3_DACPD|nr:2-nitropropane dioxygenase [Dacryopinax primogenitus]EJU03736.1 2-nitropropane dioxygenase [Dacryopinax primogenitus]
MSLQTPITELFKIQHPILLAGMNVAAGPELAAAVTNAGGMGVIGGVGYTPRVLTQQIKILKDNLKDKNAPFGVDLLLPQVGGNARKTNYDYTKGQLPALIDVIIKEKAALFVCAIGIPPKEVVDKLHAAGIPVMNMVGHPKHVPRALAAGVDLICAQGGEGGGHTGSIPFSLLMPACVDACRGKRSSFTGQPIHVIAAGGVYDGRGLAAALMFGAQAVWVGTRFVASTEAGAPRMHKEAVTSAGYDDTIRSVIFSGRPLRVRKTPYVEDWENNRQAEIAELTGKGIIPAEKDLEEHPEKSLEARPWLMGQVAGAIGSVKPAKEIVDEMVQGAVEQLRMGAGLVKGRAKL